MHIIMQFDQFYAKVVTKYMKVFFFLYLFVLTFFLKKELKKKNLRFTLNAFKNIKFNKFKMSDSL